MLKLEIKWLDLVTKLKLSASVTHWVSVLLLLLVLHTV